VIRLGEVVMITDLHRQGVSVSAIARQTGFDRKTVRRYIERGLEPPARAGRERRCWARSLVSRLGRPRHPRPVDRP
jgi:transposase